MSIKESHIPNHNVIPDDPKLDDKEFESENDKLRMAANEAKKKMQTEFVPRSGSGKGLHYHRRAANQRYRYIDSTVGEQQGWKSLSKSLVETAKQLLSAKHVEEPKGAPPLKTKGDNHPHIEISQPKKKAPKGENTDGQ